MMDTPNNTNTNTNTNTIDTINNIRERIINGECLIKNLIFKTKGWYNKNKYIIKYLNNASRCILCYEITGYNDIEYSKIIDHSNIIGYFNDNKNNFPLVSTICTGCYNTHYKIMTNDMLKKNIKLAPNNLGDIILDYLINNKINLLFEIIIHFSNSNINTKIKEYEESINYMDFNITEKKNILNNLVNENQTLSDNINLELEKFKLLNENKSKNELLCQSIKSQLTQFTIDLFKTSKNEMDTIINKYSDIQNSTKYSIPECKVCMNKEVKLVIPCGHTLCLECYDYLLKTQHNQDQNNEEDNHEEYKNNNGKNYLTCPLCRTVSNTFTQIYL